MVWSKKHQLVNCRIQMKTRMERLLRKSDAVGFIYSMLGHKDLGMDLQKRHLIGQHSTRKCVCYHHSAIPSAASRGHRLQRGDALGGSQMKLLLPICQSNTLDVHCPACLAPLPKSGLLLRNVNNDSCSPVEWLMPGDGRQAIFITRQSTR